LTTIFRNINGHDQNHYLDISKLKKEKLKLYMLLIMHYYYSYKWRQIM